MAWQLFGSRSVKRRAAAPNPNSVSFSPAVVDTAGMDPEMKGTLGSMRGALGAGPAAGAPGPFDALMKLFAGKKGK